MSTKAKATFGLPNLGVFVHVFGDGIGFHVCPRKCTIVVAAARTLKHRFITGY